MNKQAIFAMAGLGLSSPYRVASNHMDARFGYAGEPKNDMAAEHKAGQLSAGHHAATHADHKMV